MYAWHGMEGLKECVGDGLQTVLPCWRAGYDAVLQNHHTCNLCVMQDCRQNRNEKYKGSLACRHLRDGACGAQ